MQKQDKIARSQKDWNMKLIIKQVLQYFDNNQFTYY